MRNYTNFKKTNLFLRITAIASVICLFLISLLSFASCKNTTDSSTENQEPNTVSEKTLSQRKTIAENAVAKYINEQMSLYADTGLYAVIDYSKMKYTASSELAYDDKFNVSIEIYHYNSSGKAVGKNKSTIKASANVDKYGNVSDVQALNYMAVEWY